MGSLDWMADELRAAGLAVVEYPGWRDRAASGSWAPRAVMWHHDASPAGPSPSMDDMIAEVGNSSTPPPLAQCWVDTDGVWHLTASGRANHAGRGAGWGRVPANAGNTWSIGVETDHTVGEPWPNVQLASLRRGTRVVLEHLGAHASDSLCGHLEYAPGRKVDPAGLDMDAERRIVAGLTLEDDVSAAEVWNYPISFQPPGATKPVTFSAAQYLVWGNYYASLTEKLLAIIAANEANDLTEDKLRALHAEQMEQLNEWITNATIDVDVTVGGRAVDGA